MKVSNKTKQDSVTTIPKSKGHRHPKNEIRWLPFQETLNHHLYPYTCKKRMCVKLTERRIGDHREEGVG